MLIDTGLKIVTTEDGAVALRPLAGDEVDTSATPDILVNGKVNWSLNTGIERTQDDSQPFIVLGRKEIERSGAPNLETFLRNQLNVNTSPTVGDQAIGGSTAADPRRPIGVSAINLRGIGLRDTLILVDGRRQPGINLGNGDITQPSITGIPIAAVERIEVLASSASASTAAARRAASSTSCCAATSRAPNCRRTTTTPAISNRVAARSISPAACRWREDARA